MRLRPWPWAFCYFRPALLEVATDSLTECLQCNTALFVGAYVFGLGDFRRSLQDRKKIASDFTEGEDCCTPFGLQRDLRKRFSEAELVDLGWVWSQLAFPPSNSSIATNVILLPISSGPIGQWSKGNAKGGGKGVGVISNSSDDIKRE